MAKNASNRRHRCVAVITGTRAEYGLLKSTMEAIDRHPKLQLQLVVTGMHLLKKFGLTVEDITSDGWPIRAKIKMQSGDDSPTDQARGLACGVRGIAEFLDSANTDIAIVLGDRIEAMAGALAAVSTGRVLAHIHGGDVAPGEFDDSFRHAITKLAHLHFAATGQAAQRIIRLGEERNRVYVVGAPGLDRLRKLLPASGRRKARTGRALVVYHPCGRSAEREAKTMKSILRATDYAGLLSTVVYPNSDRGHQGIIATIEACRNGSSNGRVRIVRSLPRDKYLKHLIDADVLIGNSSSGIIEAATAGTPCVNIGRRQQGRQRSGSGVVDAGESLAAIRHAMTKALAKRPIMGGKTVYGDGRAGARIAHTLASVPLNDHLRRKVITY